MSIFSSYKKIFLLGFITVILIAIPFSVYIAQQRQNISSKATASTTLSFEPTLATAKVGDTVALNIWLDPGTGTTANQVSFVKLAIKFDQTAFTADSLTENTVENALKEIIDPVQYDNGAGTAKISLSIGADPTKAIVARTKIAILKLKATAATTPTSPNVTFDFANMQVLSIDNGSQTSDNVLKLSTTAPATITVTSATTTVTATPTITPTSTLTLTPTPTGISSPVSSGNPPTCTNLSVDRSTTGAAPYSIAFTAVGNDSNGTISKASFNFGDGPVQDVTTGGGLGTNSINTQISHTYNNPGTYTAYAILTDNSSNLSAQNGSCTQTITVNSAQGGSGSGTTQTVIQPLPTQVVLPPTGPGGKILGIGAIGAVLTIIGGALLILL